MPTIIADRCVYLFSYPDGTPLYVGKGALSRPRSHCMEAASGHHCYKCNTFRKIKRETGHWPPHVILATGLTTDEANEVEISTIKTFGRLDLELGPLLNLTDGGEGSPGYKPSLEVRLRLSEVQRIAQKRPEVNERRSESLRITLNISEVKTKMRRAQVKAQNRPEVRTRMKEISEFLWSNQEHINKMKAMWRNPERRKNQSAIQKIIQNIPEYKLRMTMKKREAWARPGAREKHSIVMKEIHSRQEWLANQSRSQLVAQNRPGVREKKTESNRRTWLNPDLIEGQRRLQQIPEIAAEHVARSTKWHADPKNKEAHKLAIKLGIEKRKQRLNTNVTPGVSTTSH